MVKGRIFPLLAALALAWGVTAGDALADGFAYVDVNKVVNSSEAAKKARDVFQSKLASKQKEVETMEAEIKKARDDLEKREKDMKPEERTEKGEKIRVKFREYQRLVEDYERDLTKENEKWNKKITEALREIIKELGKEKSYTAVFGKGQVLFANPGIDITDTVLQRLNERTKGSF